MNKFSELPSGAKDANPNKFSSRIGKLQSLIYEGLPDSANPPTAMSLEIAAAVG